MIAQNQLTMGNCIRKKRHNAKRFCSIRRWATFIEFLNLLSISKCVYSNSPSNLEFLALVLMGLFTEFWVFWTGSTETFILNECKLYTASIHLVFFILYCFSELQNRDFSLALLFQFVFYGYIWLNFNNLRIGFTVSSLSLFVWYISHLDLLPLCRQMQCVLQNCLLVFSMLLKFVLPLLVTISFLKEELDVPHFLFSWLQYS